MRIQGTIASWNEDRGFGFITPSGDGKQVFVHIKDVPGRGQHPPIGTRITFEMAADALGRPRAKNIRLPDIPIPWGPAAKAFLVSTVYLTFVAALATSGMIPFALPWLNLALSVLSFALYAQDKSVAGTGARRIPESTLHLLAFLGGWPGAMYAQQLLRHKTSKASFRGEFWGTVVMNVAALARIIHDCSNGD